MSTLTLQSPIPRGNLGRWLNDKEVVAARKFGVSVKYGKIRVARTNKADDLNGVLVLPTDTGYKKLDILASCKKLGKYGSYDYGVSINKFLDDAPEYEDVYNIMRDAKKPTRRNQNNGYNG